MARNLDGYEMVEDRIARFLSDYPDGRIVTFECTRQDDRAKGYWQVKAEIFEDHEDQHADTPKATGFAFEIEGTAGANQTAALENAETSAIGRALANAGYVKGKRPSRQEMLKPTRADNPIDPGFVAKIESAQTEEELTELWGHATAQGWSADLQKLFSARKQVLNG